MIDSGIDLENPAFDGIVHPASRSFPYVWKPCVDCASQHVSYHLQDQAGHGTWVSGFLARQTDERRARVSIMALKIGYGDADQWVPQPPETVTDLNGAAMHDALAYAVDSGADIVNMSFGGPAELRLRDKRAAAMRRVQARDALLVMSVPNQRGAPAVSGTMIEDLLSADRRAANSLLLAIRLGPDGRADGMNNADPGYLKHRALSVRAHGVETVALGGGITSVTGNSFAAARITAAAAEIKGRYPSMTGPEVARVLLDSADDLGAPGPDRTYGMGRLNLRRALIWIEQRSAV